MSLPPGIQPCSCDVECPMRGVDMRNALERIAAVIPYFPFKGIERFYDIGGFLFRPEVFQLVIDIMVCHFRRANVDVFAGIDARGFVLGPPVALALRKPFIMIRKQGKLPNSVTGQSYTKEYAGVDALSIPRGMVAPNSRVVLIDDLVATGGTLCAAIDLVQQQNAIVVSCACVVELKALNAREKFDGLGYQNVSVWALLDESMLRLDGLKDESIDTTGYVDDGLPH
eukprot:c52822_g1_i1.p1 GENE.c52822_g1_i1~~c52822_g1_i1.p1  ORF type:complete len:227 (+),score=52.38 c52822_g1_i1:51-731(+)